jgi:hypothetical protein
LRHGRAVAKLIPADLGFYRDKARRTVVDILSLSKGSTLGRLKIKDLIYEGRP